MSVYCGTERVGTYLSGGYVFCGGCHKRLHRIGATFALDTEWISSDHGNQDEGQGSEAEAGVVAAGSVQAGDV